jgi:lysyl-tRNA synthetase class 2
MVRCIRDTLHAWGYLEVQVPVRVTSPAMEQHLHGLAVGDHWLHTSPEFALKRVLAGGLPRIYFMGPCFRDEESGPLHTREFTMLEWYRAGAGYREIMVELESLLKAVSQVLNLPPPQLMHTTWLEAFQRHVGQAPPSDVDDATQLWVEQVEPKLTEPTLVRDYPASMAALATIRGDICERFELYWKGVEIANAYTELTHPGEALDRWTRENEARTRVNRSPHPIDDRVIEAIARHPRAGGIALGVDRLALVLLGLCDIRETRLEP